MTHEQADKALDAAEKAAVAETVTEGLIQQMEMFGWSPVPDEALLIRSFVKDSLRIQGCIDARGQVSWYAATSDPVSSADRLFEILYKHALSPVTLASRLQREGI